MRILPKALMVMLATAALAAGLASAEPNAPPHSNDPVALSKDLIAATGAAKQFEAVLPAMFAQMEPFFLQMAPGKETEVRDIMQRLLMRFAARKGEVLDEIAKIYAANLSVEDMTAMIAFFRSEPGKRFVERQPKITQESMIAGQRWGEKLGAEIEIEIRDEMKKRGIKI
ncbi:MAG: DUF2059 domain-containing protein [Hyphomicrobium sp.]|nr:DUF2059 domain-containing protein [Hyphomicrobium sp.]